MKRLIFKKLKEKMRNLGKSNKIIIFANLMMIIVLLAVLFVSVELDKSVADSNSHFNSNPKISDPSVKFTGLAVSSLPTIPTGESTYKTIRTTVYYTASYDDSVVGVLLQTMLAFHPNHL